ncbi:Crp/Fnr family transcriptional regulator [Candidatus Poribacteria bacterium]
MNGKELVKKSREHVQYKAGDAIFTEGTTGKEIYMIIDGKVEVSQRVGGKNETIATMEKGDFFGEMGPITNSPRFATTIAMENVSLEKLSLEEMLWDMHNNRELMKDMFTRMVKRLRDTTSQLNIQMVRNRPTETDTRATKVSYLRKKLEERDAEVENLKKQLELPGRYRPTPWYLSLRVVELIMLLAILILVVLKY